MFSFLSFHYAFYIIFLTIILFGERIQVYSFQSLLFTSSGNKINSPLYNNKSNNSNNLWRGRRNTLVDNGKEIEKGGIGRGRLYQLHTSIIQRQFYSKSKSNNYKMILHAVNIEKEKEIKTRSSARTAKKTTKSQQSQTQNEGNIVGEGNGNETNKKNNNNNKNVIDSGSGGASTTTTSVQGSIQMKKKTNTNNIIPANMGTPKSEKIDQWNEADRSGFDWQLEQARRSFLAPGFSPFRMDIWAPPPGMPSDFEASSSSTTVIPGMAVGIEEQPPLPNEVSFFDSAKIFISNGFQLLGFTESYDKAPVATVGKYEGSPLKLISGVLSGKLEELAGGPLFLLLNQYFLQEGSVFKLMFGPRSFIVISDPVIVKHILKSNPNRYDKGVLAEILEPIMGKGLIPADPDTWKLRRRAIVPGFHSKWLNKMVELFASCAYTLVDRLEVAAQASDLELSDHSTDHSEHIQHHHTSDHHNDHKQHHSSSTLPQTLSGILNAKKSSSSGSSSSTEESQIVDMEDLFCSVSLDIIGKAVFNYEFGSVTKGSPVIKAVYSTLREAEHRSMSFVPYWKVPFANKWMKDQIDFQENMELLNTVLDKLIKKALDTAIESDIEELENRTDAMDIEENDISLLRFLVDMRGENASSVQLRDDLMTMLIAGHETTAAVLTWTLFELVRAPEILEKVREEIDQVFDGIESPPTSISESTAASTAAFISTKKEKRTKEYSSSDIKKDQNNNNDKNSKNENESPLPHQLPLNFDNVKQLKYLRFCLVEALRLYPEPPILIRRCLFDETLPVGGGKTNGENVKIMKGTDLFISTWNLHRSPDLWEDPDKFNPDRWFSKFTNSKVAGWNGFNPDLIAGLYPNEICTDFAFLPFGGGTRKCIGDQFAMMESTVIMATILREFDFEFTPTSGQNGEHVGMRTGATIHTENGLNLIVKRRNRKRRS